MKIQTLVEYIKAKPKTIFLINGSGALITSFSLFGIGFLMQQYFGMPKSVLYILSIVVMFYAIYSLSCYFFLFKRIEKHIDKSEQKIINWQIFLKIIIIANSLYCVIMFFLLILHYKNLTILGIIYFIIEMIVIISLVVFEIKILKSDKLN